LCRCPARPHRACPASLARTSAPGPPCICGASQANACAVGRVRARLFDLSWGATGLLSLGFASWPFIAACSSSSTGAKLCAGHSRQAAAKVAQAEAVARLALGQEHAVAVVKLAAAAERRVGGPVQQAIAEDEAGRAGGVGDARPLSLPLVRLALEEVQQLRAICKVHRRNPGLACFLAHARREAQTGSERHGKPHLHVIHAVDAPVQGGSVLGEEQHHVQAQRLQPAHGHERVAREGSLAELNLLVAQRSPAKLAQQHTGATSSTRVTCLARPQISPQEAPPKAAPLREMRSLTLQPETLPVTPASSSFVLPPNRFATGGRVDSIVRPFDWFVDDECSPQLVIVLLYVELSNSGQAQSQTPPALYRETVRQDCKLTELPRPALGGSGVTEWCRYELLAAYRRGYAACSPTTSARRCGDAPSLRSLQSHGADSRALSCSLHGCALPTTRLRPRA